MVFNVGDNVKVVSDSYFLEEGDIYKIVDTPGNLIVGERMNDEEFKKTRFVMYADIAEEILKKVEIPGEEDDAKKISVIRNKIKKLDVELCQLYGIMDDLSDKVKEVYNQIDETVEAFQTLCDEAQVDWSDRE